MAANVDDHVVLPNAADGFELIVESERIIVSPPEELSNSLGRRTLRSSFSGSSKFSSPSHENAEMMSSGKVFETPQPRGILEIPVTSSVAKRDKHTRKKKPSPKVDSISSEAYLRPTADECQAVVDALSALHGERKAPSRQLQPSQSSSSRSILDSLVRTILSQNTTDRTSAQAFAQLKTKFPTWQGVLAAREEDVVESVRCGGLAEIKVQRIKTILSTLLEEGGKSIDKESGEPSLEWLRTESIETVKQQLGRFKGVGPKTVACVALFAMGSEEEFPVDTHVWRITTQRLRWLPAAGPAARSRDACYEYLNARIPSHLKYPLHVLLVEHGKRCRTCSKDGRLQLPEQGPCPLIALSKSSTTGSTTNSGSGSALAFPLRREPKLVVKKESITKNHALASASAGATRTLDMATGAGRVTSIAKAEAKAKANHSERSQRANASGAGFSSSSSSSSSAAVAVAVAVNGRMTEEGSSIVVKRERETAKKEMDAANERSKDQSVESKRARC